MRIADLIKRLQVVLKDYGDVEVDVLTETSETGQVEQALGDVAVSTGGGEVRAKLLPPNF